MTKSQASEIRVSARVLLVDAQNRLLLFQTKTAPDAPEADTLWITVGGGVEPGEDLVVAAARELREETGLDVAPATLGGVVATTGGPADLGWLSGVFRDDFFFLRIDAHEVDISGFEDLEASTYVGHRWWTLDELAETDERIVPYGLAELMRDLTAGRIPAEPVRLPWHH
ncbi:NUDIX hydrolase [Catenulispora subtropica]|uniref:Nudix hydrolase domain-containing protein n=1 Tax=Catenulispora subtropica TaxID=450798 RepID=A0ABN2RJ35_9ACTN